MVRSVRSKHIAVAAGLLAAGVIGGLASQAFAGGSTFTDVPPSHPFAEEITFVAETGIAGGYQDGTYRPGSPVTRQAMAAFLQRANTYEVVEASQFFTVTNAGTTVATCPEDRAVVAGGGQARGNSAMFLQQSQPTADGTGWAVRAVSDGGGTQNFYVDAWAICGRVNLVLPS